MSRKLREEEKVPAPLVETGEDVSEIDSKLQDFEDLGGQSSSFMRLSCRCVPDACLSLHDMHDCKAHCNGIVFVGDLKSIETQS